MLKARSWLRQAGTVYACLEQSSRSIITLEYIWCVFYYLVCLSSNSTKKVFCKKNGEQSYILSE